MATVVSLIADAKTVVKNDLRLLVSDKFDQLTHTNKLETRVAGLESANTDLRSQNQSLKTQMGTIQSDVKRLKIKKPPRNAEIQTDSSALDHSPSETRSAHSTLPSLPSETSPSSASPLCSQTTAITPSLPSVVTDNAHVHVTVSTAKPFLALANEEHTDCNTAKLAAHEHEGRTVLVPTELRPVNPDAVTGKKKTASSEQRSERSREGSAHQTLPFRSAVQNFSFYYVNHASDW